MIDFRDFLLQPTVQLRDVWKVGTKFYPRMVMTHCVLHPRGPSEFITDVEDLMTDEKTSD